VALDVARLRREEFPWAEAGEAVFLNVASTGPLPERTVRAQDAFTRKRAAPHRLSHEEQFAVLTGCRALAAELINADVGDIALAANTGAGLNLAAWGLPLGAGDVVLIPDREFPANVYPWMAAAEERGFTLHRVRAREGLLDEEALLGALEHPGVRVLSLSWVGFATGYTADLERIGAACRERGVVFVVDGIQGVGALPLDVKRVGIDLLACGAQKWLLSPWGSGFTYVSPSVLERLSPQPVSWMGVRGSDDFSTLLDYDLTWRDDARRFEQITVAYQDFAGMAASLGLLRELGWQSVADHIAERAAELFDGIERAGIPIVTPRSRRAGIVTVRPSDVRATTARLDQAKVIHSVREGTIRLAPHCYTTTSEIDVAIGALAG
jgi:cysteine desulfurase / selenocysteine lyase